MDIHFDLYTFMHLLAFVLGVLISFILWHSSRAPHLGFNKWLGFSIFSLAVALMVAFLLLSRLGYFIPHVYRTGNLFALAYMPLSYLYIRSVISQRTPSWRDWFHALPMVFYIVDFMPFFLLPAEAKLEILRSDMLTVDSASPYDESWITPPNGQRTIRTFQFFVYWLLEVRLLRSIYQLNIPGLEKDNRSWLQWALVYVGIQTMLFLPNFVAWILGAQAPLYIATNAFAALALVVSTIFLFFRPDILYGIRGVIAYKEEHAHVNGRLPGDVEFGKSQKNHAVYLDAKTVQVLKEKLEALMDTKPFLKQGYTATDLATDLTIPPYQLSAFLNQYLDSNFNDYINERRIWYCLDQIREGAWKKLTVEGIGLECGFSNRNTFTASFKKFTGETPSAYLRSANSDLPSI